MIPDRREGDEHWFKLLKPLYGDVMDALWRKYQSAKPERQARILRKVKARAMSVLDMRLGGNQKLYLDPPRPDVIGGGDYVLGSVVYPSKPPYPFTISKAEVLRHVFVLGPSGTGKTTFFLGILQQLLRDGVPFWCLDWKRNYRALLSHEQGKDIIVLTVGSDLSPLRLNMLQPPAGVGVNEWVEALADTHLQPLRNAIAHAILDNDEGTLKAGDELETASKLSKWLPLTKCIVRRMLKVEFPNEFLREPPAES